VEKLQGDTRKTDEIGSFEKSERDFKEKGKNFLGR